MRTRFLALAACAALIPGLARPALADHHNEKGPAPQAESAGAQDVLVLQDGRRLVGEIVAETDRLVSMRSDGVTRAYPRDQISSIEKGAAPAPAPAAGTPTPADPKGKQAAKAAKKAKKKSKARSVELSQGARAWLDVLVTRAGDGDPQVQRSLAAAMTALGPGAVAPLREAAANAEGGSRLFLERVARSIEQKAAKKRPGGDRPGMDARRDRRPDKLGAALAEEISLRDEQRPAFDAAMQRVVRSQRDITKAAHAGDIGAEEVTAQVDALRADTLRDMKPVLDEAQFLLFDEMTAKFFDGMTRRITRMKGKKKKPGSVQ